MHTTNRYYASAISKLSHTAGIYSVSW